MKKYYNLLKISIVACFGLLVQLSQAQTTVNSLSELLPYLDDDNVDVKLAPGTYTIGFNEVIFGDFNGRNPLFLFEGSNSTFDFTGVTINFDTYIFQAFGSVDVNEIQILGNNNVLKNLTMEDIGTLAPTSRAQAIVMDGRDNRIEGFHLTVRGSYPYGYGDAFGKGGGAVIPHRKHSGILIRGLRNHLKNTTVISRSYGHCVFMQAASYPTIEGCYIEGEMRTTDDMLAETSGPAFDVNFMTDWGYTLPAGYMMSLQEAGIRAYNAGTTYIDGVEIQRGTDNPTVLNCTIKNARTGVVLAHATGTKYVENCVAIGCEQGYSIGSGIVVNCSADAAYGPVYKNAYASDSGYNADITILEPIDGYYNGHQAIAYIGGKRHNLTFRSEVTDFPSDLKIMMAGDMQGLRVLNGNNASQNNHTLNDIFLKNLTNFPVVIHSDATNNRVQDCFTGNIANGGSGNFISALNCASDNLALLGAAVQSSTDFDGLANRAIDGNTSGTFNLNSVTHTNPSDTDAWWQVNLTEEKPIGDIIVWNRTDSNTNRLANFEVKVFDSNGAETFSHIYNESDGPLPSVTIDAGGALGKRVRVIQLNNAVALSLAEVQVFESALSVKENVLDEVSLYPNPVSDYLSVSLAGSKLNSGSAVLSIYNITGKKVLEFTAEESNTTKLNLSSLNSGVYLLNITDKVNSITKKIVKL
ncbi:T9SS type A sorting domain-containing protein [Seonamhaeicola sp. MEBiC1930]|uniref:T9SS type A sorting domain-containing protein n=1 Tax=Seonamhaeicola sp. MEBiC01930 TaxID=2976768 RepID=UPI0032524F31